MATASSALIPAQGAADPCEALPVKTASKADVARQVPYDKPADPGGRSASAGVGWIINAASTPANAPALISFTFPAPPSSAGQPSRRTRPRIGLCLRLATQLIKAAMEETAMRLWPQPCPIPGRASYSAQKVTRQPPAPYSARKDVSNPKACRTTGMPFASKNAVMLSCAFTSSKHSSGVLCIFRSEYLRLRDQSDRWCRTHLHVKML